MGMLRQAEARGVNAGLAARLKFRQMDAESLAFDSEFFDVAVSLFVLLHLPNPLTAARELHRVLRSGGRVAVGAGGGAVPQAPPGVGPAAHRVWGGIETVNRRRR